MDQPLETLTAALLEAAQKAGADAADALAVAGTSISIDMRGGALEQASRAEGIDIGLRVLIGQRQACVSSSSVSAATIAEMAQRAVAMAREAPEDSGVGLADPAQLSALRDADALALSDPAAEPDPAELQEAALRAEAAALAHPGISMVETAAAAYGRSRLHLAASNGFSGGYTRTDNSLYVVAITGEGTGMERDYAGESRICRADLPTPEEIGQLAAERTIARAGPRRPPSGAWPVLFDERVAAGLIGHLVQAVNGAAIVRGASWLRAAMGEQVLPRGMSLIEQPTRPGVSGSRPFDAEGLACAERAIVTDGVLERWVLDLGTARRLGMDSTANAARATSAPPSPAVGNLWLTPGPDSRADLIAQMGTGLIVTSLIGATINPTTGDYSRGAAGLWVENGQITGPVSGVTIAGNLREMLRSLRAANDGRAWMSRVVPSLLVEGLTLAGD